MTRWQTCSVPLLHGQVQRCRAALGVQVRLRSALEQQAHALRVSEVSGMPQRRHAALLVVNQGSHPLRSEEIAKRLVVARSSGVVEQGCL